MKISDKCRVCKHFCPHYTFRNKFIMGLTACGNCMVRRTMCKKDDCEKFEPGENVCEPHPVIDICYSLCSFSSIAEQLMKKLKDVNNKLSK